MAVLDAALEFSDAQALASLLIATPVASTNIAYRAPGVDAWGTAKNLDLGQLTFNVDLGVAMVGASSVLTATLVTKADASISSGATTIAAVTFPATSAAGTRKAFKLPIGAVNLGYFGIMYSTTGATLTSATVDAYLNLDNEVHD